MSEIMRRIGQGEAAEGQVKVMTVDPLHGKETRVKVLRIETAFILFEYLERREKVPGSGKVGNEHVDFVSLPAGGCKREWMSHDRFTGCTREVANWRWP